LLEAALLIYLRGLGLSVPHHVPDAHSS
jgi:hypothetical protein